MCQFTITFMVLVTNKEFVFAQYSCPQCSQSWQPLALAQVLSKLRL